MPTPVDPLLRLLRALLLAAERPLAVAEVVSLIADAVAEEEWTVAADAPQVEAALATLQAELQGTGVDLVLLSEGWRLRTAPDLGLMVRRLWPERVSRLSRAALEALSVVAYRQPCTRAEVEEVRGVDCGSLLKTLLERRLLAMVGRKEEPGRPLLYGTTPFFLETFSLTDLRALPTLRDLAALEAEEAARTRGSSPSRRAPNTSQLQIPESPQESSTDPTTMPPH